MTLIFKPAVAISNSLRFKAKFSLLAVMFYVPLIVSFIWIVKQQFSDLSQYQQELSGNAQITSMKLLEQLAADSRLNSGNVDQVSQHIDTLKLTTQDQQVIQEGWQALLSGDMQFTDFAMFYDKTLALRESLSAVSGLSREPDPQAFYLAEAAVIRMPALVEYISRIKDLTFSIINNDGFSAQTYTLLVALDNRVDELQLQYAKTNEQLKRVAPNMFQEYLSQYQDVNADLDAFQTKLRDEVINPDAIIWTASQAKTLGNNQHQSLMSLMALSEQLLVKRIENLQSKSTQTLWLLAIMLVVIMLAISYVLVGIYRSLNENVNNIKPCSRTLR